MARTFTTFYPNTVIISAGIHIHHFWYGIAILALGGWLGISYDDERINRLSAILFGAGGGLIGDEFGLLLTLNDYWTKITYTLVIMLLTLASILILAIRYEKAIRTEVSHFARSSLSFYFGVFLAAVSIAFIMETDDLLINSVAAVLTIVASGTILAYFIQRIRTRRQKPKPALSVSQKT